VRTKKGEATHHTENKYCERNAKKNGQKKKEKKGGRHRGRSGNKSTDFLDQKTGLGSDTT